jgi:hypothetical protein
MAAKKKGEKELKPDIAELFKSLSKPVPSDEEARQKWPTLMDCLLPRYDAQGKMTREAGRLTIKAQGTAWLVSLACPTEEYATSIVVQELGQTFETFEAALAGNGVNWIPDYESVKKARQRLKDAVS